MRQSGAVAVVVSPPPRASLGIQVGSELNFVQQCHQCSLGKREQGVRQAGAVAVVVSAPPRASLGIQDGSELFFFFNSRNKVPTAME